MNPNPYIDADLQALADAARRFATERVAPGFLERDKTRTLDEKTIERVMGNLVRQFEQRCGAQVRA